MADFYGSCHLVGWVVFRWFFSGFSVVFQGGFSVVFQWRKSTRVVLAVVSPAIIRMMAGETAADGRGY